MANTLSPVVDSIASDRSTFTIADETTYSSPARSGVGVFMTVQKMNQDSSVDETLTITSDDSDPETDSSWTVPATPGDGWYRALMVSVPDYSAGTTYALYDAAFDPSTDSVYRSKQAGNVGNSLANTTYWEAITSPGTLALNEGESNESANIDSTVFEFIISANSEYAFANQIAEASEQYLTSQFIPDRVLDTYSTMAVLVDAMYVDSDRAQYSRGERIVQRFNSFVESLS